MYRKKLTESKKIKTEILESLVERLESLYKGKKEHIERLMKMANRFAKYLNLSNRKKEQLILVAKYHDLGKLQVLSNIILKPGAPNEEEWESIKRHCEVGYRIISSTMANEEVAGAILEHHERWDGAGYPREIKGTRIMFLARVFSIMDAYDIMTNGAPYKGAISEVDAIEELKRNAGTQFDPVLVEKFVGMLSKE
jgi:HD-GYP domain-containing protein (c-di-GMP phosphodiesterase class II)